jgi:hypothetical protein
METIKNTIKMKTNLKVLALSLVTAGSLALTGCGKDDEVVIVPRISVSSEVDGVWEKGTIVEVTDQISVPVGKTLTIEEGVQVIISGDPTDANNTKIEFIVHGNLYCYGTAANPITFTTDEDKRDKSTSGRHWGGIIGSTTCGEIVFDHVVVEYTGAILTASSPSVTEGLFKAEKGAAMVAFNTNNVN